MKQETIKALLAKREAGTLTDEELEMLNRLTRRDEVVAGAERQAKVIVTRRRRTLAACVAAFVVAGAVGLIFTQRHDTVPMMAQQEAVVEIPEEEDIMAPVEVEPQQTAAVNVEKTVAPAKADRKHVAKPTAKDPVVMCNSQCDADSVISDIWKFLTA
jgi:hypothetical protein